MEVKLHIPFDKLQRKRLTTLCSEIADFIANQSVSVVCLLILCTVELICINVVRFLLIIRLDYSLNLWIETIWAATRDF